MTFGLFSCYVGLIRYWLWSRAAKRDPQGTKWRYAYVLVRGYWALIKAEHRPGGWDRAYHRLERAGISSSHLYVFMDRRLRTCQRRDLQRNELWIP